MEDGSAAGEKGGAEMAKKCRNAAAGEKIAPHDVTMVDV